MFNWFFAETYIYEKVDEPDDENYEPRWWKKLHETCCRDSWEGRFENCGHNKVKRWFGKNEKKNSAHCD